METFDIRWAFMPYCIQRLADGRSILLNRSYKPVGMLSSDWVNYESHPSAIKVKITAATAKKLSATGSDDLDRIYLYNDGCVPTHDSASMRAYQERLAVLMALKVETP